MKNTIREQIIEWVAMEIQPAVSEGKYDTIVALNSDGWVTPYGTVKLSANELEHAEARAWLANRDGWDSLGG